MRYTVILEREADGGYVVSVPALPGCVSQGDTRAEAVDNVREAIALYVEDCINAGDPVPTEAGKEFVEVDAAMWLQNTVVRTNDVSFLRPQAANSSSGVNPTSRAICRSNDGEISRPA